MKTYKIVTSQDYIYFVDISNDRCICKISTTECYLVSGVKYDLNNNNWQEYK